MSLIAQAKYLSKIYQARPNKGLSQNFLIAENIYEKIITAAELTAEDYVLEIGSGWGFLTGHLLAGTKKVLAVEADVRLAKYLQQSAELSNKERLLICSQDILRLKNEEITQKLELPLGQPYKIVANLPYHITSAVIEKFLAYQPKPQLMVLLVQKEVAQRLCAKPRSSAGEGMSILSVATQFYAEPEIIDYVKASCFWPEPKVDSAIVRLKVKRASPQVDEKKFFHLVKVGFSARRKQLHNNLAAGWKIDSTQTKAWLTAAGLAPTVRPQDLAVADWLELFKQTN
ncbi:MAG: 16S rRNA (adenine(1518)-N(6)/adenine(1519)-N(6))-dimethyltransferase RsmA [Candidatus Buchananbacteria bacterium]